MLKLCLHSATLTKTMQCAGVCLLIVFRSFRIQGTVLTSGIGSNYTSSQHFKANI